MGDWRINNWTPERVERLSMLWKEGWSASEIAGALGGLTRSAVIGKCHRLKLTQGKRRAPLPRCPRARAAVRAHQKRVFEKPAPKPDPEALHLALLDLGPRDCRWPYGTKPYTFCGHPQAADSSYCPVHLMLSRRQGTQQDFDRIAGRTMHGWTGLAKAVVFEDA